MNLFAKRKPEKRLRTQQIKAIVAELLELDQDVTVMVTELTCRDDGCPEVETVIAIFRPEQPKLQITLHSSIEELTDADIDRSCRNVDNQSNRSEEVLLASEQHN